MSITNLVSNMAGCSACACGVPGACDPYYEVSDIFHIVVRLSIVAIIGTVIYTWLSHRRRQKKGKAPTKNAKKAAILNVVLIASALAVINAILFFTTTDYVDPAKEVEAAQARCQGNPTCEY